MARQKNDSDPPVKNKRTTNKTLQPTPKPVKKNVSNNKQVQDSKKLSASKNLTIVVGNDLSGAHLQDQQRRVHLPDPPSVSGNISKGKQVKNPQKPALLLNSKSISQNTLLGTRIQNSEGQAPSPVLTATENVPRGMQIRSHQGLTLAPVLDRLPSNFSGNSYTTNFQDPLRSGFTSATASGANNFRSQTAARSDFGSVSRDFVCPTARSIAVVSPNNFMLTSNSTLNNSSGLRFTNTVTSAASIVRNPSALGNMNSNQFGNNGASFSNSAISFVHQDDDDVSYLFTVDSTPNGQIVEEIDLSQESEVQNLIPTGANNSVEPIDLSRESETTNVTTQSTNEAPTTNLPASPKVEKTRKRKASDTNEKSNKRANTNLLQPRCSICEVHYDELISSNEQMCISTSCGHLFCLPCIRKGEKICKICGARVYTCRKLFL